ncbi:Hydrogenase 3 maturation peptidase Hycl, Aspartic peptidase, MEROPS family A31 [Verrucomicrobia bacterium]|nr:Hydrogenase 3 maturation peptidase Hycl, Aspartic peptidase, MEROPS family A31 [Verrucomicrobiota bacterium]
MPDLRDQLLRCFQGRVCLMGLGNVDYGDDGFGVRLAERLQRGIGSKSGNVRIMMAGDAPERFLGRCADESHDHLMFLDAVEFGGEPGAVVFLNSNEVAECFPQISTHKISLNLLAKCIEANGKTQAWLLGVQPQSLARSQHLTPRVEQTFELLIKLLGNLLSQSNVC